MRKPFTLSCGPAIEIPKPPSSTEPSTSTRLPLATMRSLLALFARATSFRRPGSLGGFASISSGICFGWAGLLLAAALLRTVYLPWLPAVVTPVWLLVGAVISWMAGRGLLAREGAR